jgi:nucleoporin NUP42
VIQPQTPQPPPNQGLGNTSSFGNSSSSAFGNNSNSAFGSQQNGVVGNQGATTPGNGQITAGGGIAGVASMADGKGIKLVNDQKKYKLWEFYYDMRKEQQAAAGLSQNPNGQGTQGTPGSNGSTLGQPSQSGFGTGSSTLGSSSSTFGSSSFTFGSGTTQQAPTAPITPSQSQQ